MNLAKVFIQIVILLVVFSLTSSFSFAADYSDISNIIPSSTDISRDAIGVDVDNDGDLDIFIANDGQNKLIVNDEGTGFSDGTGLLPSIDDDSFSLASGDVIGDEFADIFVGNLGQNRLLINDGGTGFTDATSSWLPTDSQLTISAAFGDIDGDDDIDLVVADSINSNS